MIEDNNIKLCKDCKYYENFWMDKSLSKCYNPKSIDYRIDPITGKIKYAFCSSERAYNTSHTCGQDAKFFEPKPKGFWKRMFSN